ncbi:hypothetical protein [Methylotetracoccus oryzae]
MLETALQANPRDHDVLYNLGMVCSDEGHLQAMAGSKEPMSPWLASK